MKAKTAVLSISHFIVDMACAALFFGYVSGTGGAWYAVVVYNALAFLFQLPLGIIADKLDRDLPFAAAGCALVAAAFIFARTPLVAVAVAGLGNGMFHVGGGIEVMNSSPKAGPLGVFVSPGAIGLFLGKFFAAFFRTAWFIPVGLLVIAGAGIMLCGVKKRFVSDNPEFSVDIPPRHAVMLGLLFLVVALRSFMGFTPAFSTGEYLSPLPALLAGLIPVLLLAFGKAAGGFAADAFGEKPTAVVSLGLCAMLLIIPGAPVMRLAALFLFNMTMPITLHASRRLLKNAQGAAFGLLTAALFVGLIPVLLAFKAPDQPILYGALAIVSLALLIPGLGFGKRRKA